MIRKTSTLRLGFDNSGRVWGCSDLSCLQHRESSGDGRLGEVPLCTHLCGRPGLVLGRLWQRGLGLRAAGHGAEKGPEASGPDDPESRLRLRGRLVMLWSVVR